MLCYVTGSSHKIAWLSSWSLQGPGWSLRLGFPFPHLDELADFKTYTKKELKPTRHKHFSKGNKSSNKLLTRIRVGRSYLNQHRYSIGLSESPQCLCHFREESPLHYFIDCFLYLPERQAVFSLIEHYIPHFTNLNKKPKIRNRTTWN